MKHVFIIAEAGVNHNGSLELAKKLVDVAAMSGADTVKFQTFKAVNLVSRSAEKAEYQKKTTNSGETEFEMIKKLELDIAAHKASLEPHELLAMVQSIRNIENMLGSSIKKASPSENKNKIIARKLIVAGAKIKKGETFNEKNLVVKRPGSGISPMLWDVFIGTTAKKITRKMN